MSRLAVIVTITLLLAACGGEEFKDLRDFVDHSGADMRGKISPPPEITPYEPFIYNNSTGIQDPFKPRKPDLSHGTHAGLNQPNLDRPKEELEEYALESLQMVGYLEKENTGYAIIRSPDGKLHRIKAGNYIGLNYGEVISVTDSKVKIKEMVQDSSGDWSERDTSLQLVE